MQSVVPGASYNAGAMDQRNRVVRFCLKTPHGRERIRARKKHYLPKFFNYEGFSNCFLGEIGEPKRCEGMIIG